MYEKGKILAMPTRKLGKNTRGTVNPANIRVTISTVWRRPFIFVIQRESNPRIILKVKERKKAKITTTISNSIVTGSIRKKMVLCNRRAKNKTVHRAIIP